MNKILFFIMLGMCWTNAGASEKLGALLEIYGNPLSVLSATMLQLLPELQYPSASLQMYPSSRGTSRVLMETGLPEGYVEDNNWDLFRNRIDAQARRLTSVDFEIDESDLRILFDHSFLNPAEQFFFDKNIGRLPITNRFDDPIQKLEALRHAFVGKIHRYGIKRGSQGWDQLDRVLTSVYNFFISAKAHVHNESSSPIEHFLPVLRLCDSMLTAIADDK